MRPSAAGKRGVRQSLVESTSRLIHHLEKRNDILLLTTSTRYRKDTWDVPKTTQLAQRVRDHLKEKKRRVTLLDVPTLKIHTCEGNVSGGKGNRCGLLAAKLRDRSKNPTGHHRCWASINNKDDQLYRISRELFRSRVVVFFVSVRWGQTNSVYQRLLPRSASTGNSRGMRTTSRRSRTSARSKSSRRWFGPSFPADLRPRRATSAGRIA